MVYYLIVYAVRQQEKIYIRKYYKELKHETSTSKGVRTAGA